MKTSPKTISTKPAICSSRNWFSAIESPIAAAPAPRRTKNATSPATKGRLERTIRPGRARLAEPVGLDRRDRREVARHEREHAGREERDEARSERDGDAGRAHRSSAHSNRASSSSSRRSTSGSRGGGSRGGSSRTRAERERLQPHASAADDDAPRRAIPASGSSHASQSKPCRGGHGQHASAELVDELRLDLALRVAGRDPHPDERLHPARDLGVRGVERRVADRADELGLELGRGRPLLARPRGRRERQRDRDGEGDREGEGGPHAAARARSIPSSSSPASSTGPAIR